LSVVVRAMSSSVVPRISATLRAVSTT
jgi:hypothetical protein